MYRKKDTKKTKKANDLSESQQFLHPMILTTAVQTFRKKNKGGITVSFSQKQRKKFQISSFSSLPVYL